MNLKSFLNKYDAILLSLGVFILYLICMPKTVALEDDGLFILSSYYNGVSHPPGYPLHSLLGYLFTHLPFGNPAANLHALSALFGALSIWMLWHVMLLITGRKFDAMVAGIALALSTEFWSQAIISEVYTLNSFLFITTLWFTLFLKKHNFLCPGKIFFGLGLSIGLGVSNHWPLYILASTGIAVLVLPAYRELFKHKIHLITGLLLGLLPWVWLYINLQRDPFISFLGPIDGLSEFISYIRRDFYQQDIDSSPSATWADKWNYIFYAFQLVATQLGLIGGFIMMLGLLRASKYIDRQITLALLTTLLFTCVTLPLLLDYDSDWDIMILFPPYLLLAFMVGAIFFSFGIRYLQQLSARFLQPKAQLIILAAIFTFALFINVQTNYRADYQWARLYAKLVLDTVKENAVIFVINDISVGSIGYLRYVENYRPDVTLIPLSGTVLGTRLYVPNKVTQIEREKIIKTFVQNSERPIYFTQPSITNFGYINHWLVFEYSADIPPKIHQLVMPPAIFEHIETILDTSTNDRWTYLHKQIIKFDLIPHLVRGIKNTKNSDIKHILRNYLSRSVNDLNTLSALLLVDIEQKILESMGGTDKWIALGWEWFAEEKGKKPRAQFLRALGKRELALNNSKQALNYFRLSIQEWKNTRNKTYTLIHELCRTKKISGEMCTIFSDF